VWARECAATVDQHAPDHAPTPRECYREAGCSPRDPATPPATRAHCPRARPSQAAPAPRPTVSDTDQREQVRHITEKETDAIIVASYGTFSTGINIRNLHNIIFASPSKSRIRNLQSIGRGLRTSGTKDRCKLFDIGDDLSYKSRKNFTLLHMAERIRIYNDENFEYKIVKVQIS
jgi:hypothetical protein